VSATHQKRPEMSCNLADLMCHRVSTAQRCHRLTEREKSPVAASQALSEVFRPSTLRPETIRQPPVKQQEQAASTGTADATHCS